MSADTAIATIAPTQSEVTPVIASSAGQYSPALVAAAMPEEEAWKLLAKGDWTGVPTAQRIGYLLWYTMRLGLDPLTQPFEFITDAKGKTFIYARKGCAEQIKRKERISIEVLELTSTDTLVRCRVRGTTPDGRTDEEVGTVPNTGTLADKANNEMKAMTKAKRRLVLSMAGLGMLDESEVEYTQARQPAGNAVTRKAPASPSFAPTNVTPDTSVIEGEVIDTTTGEVIGTAAPQPPPPAAPPPAPPAKVNGMSTTAIPTAPAPPGMNGTATVTKIVTPQAHSNTPRRMPPAPPPAKITS